MPSLQYQSLITFDYPSLSITHHSRLTVEIARPSLSITRHKGFIQMQCWQAGAERSTFRALLRARFTQMLCPQACGLLQLPTKVRLRIYPYAPRASIITGDFPTVVTALQLVNRQVTMITPDTIENSVRSAELALFEKLASFVLVTLFLSQPNSLTGVL